MDACLVFLGLDIYTVVCPELSLVSCATKLVFVVIIVVTVVNVINIIIIVMIVVIIIMFLNIVIIFSRTIITIA